MTKEDKLKLAEKALYDIAFGKWPLSISVIGWIQATAREAYFTLVNGETTPLEFEIDEVFKITGRGEIFTTVMPVDMDEQLSGKKVLLDGRLFQVNGVERFLHNRGLRKGDKISLLGKFL